MGIVNKKSIKNISLEDFNVKENNENLVLVNKKSNHYVNNKDLYEEFCAYHKRKVECLEKGEEKPPLTNKIGSAILQIARRRCNHRRYARYSVSWKEEMIDNAIEKCILYCNFDPALSKNPFAYLTQICDNAIKQQRNIELKELYKRYKSILEFGSFYGELDDNIKSDDIQVYHDPAIELRMREFVTNFESYHFPNKDKKKKIPKDVLDIDEFISKDD